MQAASGSQQNLIAFGQLSSNGQGVVVAPRPINAFSDIGDIDQLVCSKSLLLALTKSGHVYTTSVNVDSSQVLKTCSVYR